MTRLMPWTGGGASRERTVGGQERVLDFVTVSTLRATIVFRGWSVL